MVNITRAWTDPDYFASLSDAERAEVPANPAGSVDLSMSELRTVAGARMAAASCTTCHCCYSKRAAASSSSLV